MKSLIARWRSRWNAAGLRRCLNGRHAWSSIADRIYCKRCQLWR